MRSDCLLCAFVMSTSESSTRPLVHCAPVAGSHSASPTAAWVSTRPAAVSAAIVGSSGVAFRSPASTVIASGCGSSRRVVDDLAAPGTCSRSRWSRTVPGRSTCRTVGRRCCWRGGSRRGRPGRRRMRATPGTPCAAVRRVGAARCATDAQRGEHDLAVLAGIVVVDEVVVARAEALAELASPCARLPSSIATISGHRARRSCRRNRATRPGRSQRLLSAGHAVPCSRFWLTTRTSRWSSAAVPIRPLEPPLHAPSRAARPTATSTPVRRIAAR